MRHLIGVVAVCSGERNNNSESIDDILVVFDIIIHGIIVCTSDVSFFTNLK